MRLTSRIKKLEERSNVGFVVVVPKIEYLGADCSGAVAKLDDEVVYQGYREQGEDIAEFKNRFARESKEVCRERLSGKARTVVVLDEKVRLL